MSEARGTRGPVTFMNRTYEEALALLLEVRSYLAHQEPADRALLRPVDRLNVSLETTRMTAMLTQVIAWLMIHKAASRGEIPRKQVSAPENRLGGQAVCLDASAVSNEDMPKALRMLLARSHQLYVRVSRLDQLVAREG